MEIPLKVKMQVTQWIYKHQSVNTYLENIKNYKSKNKKRSNTEIVKRLKRILLKKRPISLQKMFSHCTPLKSVAVLFIF